MSTKPNQLAIVCDLDNCLLDDSHRIRKALKKPASGLLPLTDSEFIDWDVYFKPNLVVADDFNSDLGRFLSQSYGIGISIFFLTSRFERIRNATEESLAVWGVNYYTDLIMRKDDDFRESQEFKSEALRKLCKTTPYKFILGLGDTDGDRKAYEDNNIPCQLHFIYDMEKVLRGE